MTEPGVGTNRYACSFNDPVNLRDPGGNDVAETMLAVGAGACFASGACEAGALVVVLGLVAYLAVDTIRGMTIDPEPDLSTEGMIAFPGERARVLDTPV